MKNEIHITSRDPGPWVVDSAKLLIGGVTILSLTSKLSLRSDQKVLAKLFGKEYGVDKIDFKIGSD
ncbi:246_t:CDS:2 [Racocetra persica]|uniref:246_t:CDS:1 n=1 Tax=Racocetra persica TaxID=160502 RepID=A0ACA9KAC2_9GLOM|nr:246_t:CDS:2 [Racocetra persica]